MNTLSKYLLNSILYPVGLMGLCVSAQAVGTPAQSADVIRVTTQATGAMSSVSGTVIPVKEAALAAQIPGIVNKLGGKVGDTIPKGAILFAIDPASILAQRAAAVASYNSAVSALRNAQIQYNKEIYAPQTGRPTGMGLPSMMDSFMKPFSGQYAGPHDPYAARQSNLASRRQAIDGANFQITQVLAQIRGIDAKLNDATIRAPFDGVIVSKSIEVGDTVQPGQPLMKFADTTQLQIKAEVPERLMRDLQLGVRFPVRIDRIGNLEAVVSQIYPVSNNSLRTVTVKFDLPETINDQPTYKILRPGMYAEILMADRSVNQQALPVIPRTALVQNGPLPTVFVCSNKKRSTRYVTVGGNTVGNSVTILSGIKVGDYVVVDPANSDKSSVCKAY